MMLTLVFMIGILGIVGLAIDTGHILVNKTRLQNALDAAALSAAVTLNSASNNSTAQASAAGIATFDLFKNSAGNSELSGVTLTAADFSYSDRVNLFSAGLGGTPNFVRVSTNALQVTNFFIQVVTGNSTENISSVSTAGPVGQNCDLVPLVLCADVDPATGLMDKDCSEGLNGEPGECYGYTMGAEEELHSPFCMPNDTACQDTELESGNFTLLRFEGNAGGADLRDSLAGTVDVCSVGVELESEPGNKVGAVAQGINARFYSDTITSPYDIISHPTAATPAYDTYVDEQSLPLDNPDGAKDNRLVAVPIGDCTGLQQGNTTFDFQTDGSGNMAAMCVLIRQDVKSQGVDDDPNHVKNSIYVELQELCPALGQTNPANPVLYGPFRIVLFKSEGSGDS